MLLVGLARYQSKNHRLLEHTQVFGNNIGDSVGLAVGRHQSSTLSRAHCHIEVDYQAILIIRSNPDLLSILTEEQD